MTELKWMDRHNAQVIGLPRLSIYVVEKWKRSSVVVSSSAHDITG